MVSTQLKNISQIRIISPNRGENKKYLKPPPRFPFKMVPFLGTCSFSGGTVRFWKRMEKDVPFKKGFVNFFREPMSMVFRVEFFYILVSYLDS